MACATSSKKPTNQVIVEVPKVTYPPDELLKDCKMVTRDINTNRELAEAYSDNVHNLRLCTADKKALREWRDTLKQSEEKDK